jgi:Osmosensitive K+ channel histidine kinase
MQYYVRDGLRTLLVFCIATFLSYCSLHLTDYSYYIFLCYILATIIIARITSGYFFGILASVATVIATALLIRLPKKDYPLTFLGLFLILIITSTTTAHLKRLVESSRAREEMTKKLLDINRSLLTTRGITNIISLSLDWVVRFTGTSAIFYEGDSQSGKKAMIRCTNMDHEKVLHSYHEKFIAHWVFENGERAGVGTSYCGKSSATYFPIISHGAVLAVIGVFCDELEPLKEDEITFLNLMYSQIAMAIERQNLSDSQHTLAIETEKEKMRSNLLRAISHDLRTPLTGMIGASTTLLENREQLSDKKKEMLLRHIQEDSNWLLHMVENLLSVTRIREGHTAVTKVPEPLEEVVSEVIMKTKKNYPNAQISAHVPDEFLMVPMDATLIEQVLLNLVENSIKYSNSDEPTELLVNLVDKQVEFHVMDRGIGLEESKIETIFDGYSMNDRHGADSAKGMGIGLSICKTIIYAHGGTITAKNREDCGAIFTFTLPLEGESDCEC